MLSLVGSIRYGKDMLWLGLELGLYMNKKEHVGLSELLKFYLSICWMMKLLVHLLTEQ